LDWDDLKIAHAIARHGSLNAAARALGTTQPTISRRLDALERRIGAKLFERAASGLSPTALCAGLFESLNHMEEGAVATFPCHFALRDSKPIRQGSVLAHIQAGSKI
jgi:DNA-binding transcriptional LysR family regulator